MRGAKDEILDNIRKALHNVPAKEASEDVEVPRMYRQHGKLLEKQLVQLFIERISEYKATVRQVNPNELASAIRQSCSKAKVGTLIVPNGFPQEWLPDSVTLLHDEAGGTLSYQQLDDSDGVITTCALAIAETGTIILDAGKGQGRRVLTLLPDYHICIVRASQIVELVAEGFANFELKVKESKPPITFISGPSATSDIELSRVEGVHGPRKLEVIIY